MTKTSKLVLFLPILACFALVAGHTQASQSHFSTGLFPNDAINLRTDFLNNTTSILGTPASGSVWTVLYISTNSDTTRATAYMTVSCGSNVLLQLNNFAKNGQVERFKMEKCSNSIRITPTGFGTTDQTSLNLIYAPYNVASVSFGTNIISISSGSVFNPSILTNQLSSSSFNIFASFTSGEIVISLLLFTLCCFSIFGILRRYS